MAAGIKSSAGSSADDTSANVLVTPISTRPSTPTRGLPTRNLRVLSAPPTAWRFWIARLCGLPSMGSRSNGSSLTTGSAIAAMRGPRAATCLGLPTPAPSRIPATNGKAERFNRTLLDEWAYVRFYGSEAERAGTLDGFVHTYNHHRYHTAVGGPPISRVNNVGGHHS